MGSGGGSDCGQRQLGRRLGWRLGGGWAAVALMAAAARAVTQAATLLEHVARASGAGGTHGRSGGGSDGGSDDAQRQLISGLRVSVSFLRVELRETLAHASRSDRSACQLCVCVEKIVSGGWASAHHADVMIIKTPVKRIAARNGEHRGWGSPAQHSSQSI